ncbi:histidine phosphatase family protein [Sphingobium aromaticiconvertens]|uniref:histidine phosphatase family protein n=1 Tax=Sphingobium aromaticiconvertens TaxID=365341 RepID=UPI00301619AF
MNGRIFIIRHGNTFGPGETPRRIGAGTDLPLVESGRAQADRLGAYFAKRGLAVSAIFSSPLLRARETAERIGAALRLAPDGTLLWLNEIDHGPDEGQSEDAVIERIGTEAIERWDRQGIAPPDWAIDAEARIAAWQAFFRQTPAGDHLLVTSNGAARFALLALGASTDGLKLRTGAYGELAIGPNGAATLSGWDIRPEA